jgi:hypothetical protein
MRAKTATMKVAISMASSSTAPVMPLDAEALQRPYDHAR